MKSLNYWQHFTNTGKVEDYLSYIGHQDNTPTNYVRQKEDLGVNPYAGIYQCNRNDIKTDANRGIR